MKEKNFGWVVEIFPKSRFYPTKGRGRKFYSQEQYATTLRNAYVVPDREWARGLKAKDETVRKVSLTRTGRAKKIIGRG